MISKASSTSFQSGHIRDYGIRKGAKKRTKPLAAQAQTIGLAGAYTILKNGNCEHLGKNFDYEEGLHSACFHPGKSKTGYELVQDRDSGDMVAYKPKDPKTNKPASILLIRGDQEIKMNDDEPGLKSIFNSTRAALQDFFRGGK